MGLGMYPTGVWGMYVITKGFVPIGTLDTSLCVCYTPEMDKRDRIRILRIDNQLVELEAEIKDAQDYEAINNVQSFAKSKGLLYRYETLQRKRKNLLRSVTQKLTRQQTYSIELERRKKEVQGVDAEIEIIKQDLISLYASALGTGLDIQDEITIKNKLLSAKKLVLYNKERAVQNWLAKMPDEVPIPKDITIKVKDRPEPIDINAAFDIPVSFDAKERVPLEDVNMKIKQLMSTPTTFDMMLRPEEKDQQGENDDQCDTRNNTAKA